MRQPLKPRKLVLKEQYFLKINNICNFNNFKKLNNLTKKKQQNW